MVSFDANGNELGPEITLACSATIDVPDTAGDHVITVRVAYDGSACTDRGGDVRRAREPVVDDVRGPGSQVDVECDRSVAMLPAHAQPAGIRLGIGLDGQLLHRTPGACCGAG